MRIIGGALGGRRFGRAQPVTRPTSDRVREALASIVDGRHGFEERRVLDLFAGTGGLGLEALSRGAASATFVELDRRAAQDLESSIVELELGERARVVRADLTARGGLERVPAGPFDLVFADPPYAIVASAIEALERLAERGAFAAEFLGVLEHATRDRAAFAPNSSLAEVARYRYGDTSLLLFTHASEASSDAKDA